MALAPGARLGSFEVTGSLGAGGMGEVYRARDSKLKRDVALKVLPADVATDRERLARFQREAEVLASLNHPHIAHVHGLEESGGTIALVMELVEGEDLSQRIARGPIPVDDALPIARQIADALEAAHDAGIIHRDLKPANIKVRNDGTVKVLDFGLAKALDPPVARDFGAAQAPAPTITSPAMTAAGIVLGTAAYMSPEQAKGKAVDKRADIWAFGCVLYEMLTGRRAFDGEDITDTLTSVMRDTPDWHALPAATPAPARTLLRRCLEKDARKRVPHMAVARLEIDDALGAPAPEGTPPSSSAFQPQTHPNTRAWTAALTAAALVAAAFAVPAIRHLLETVPVEPLETRVDIVTPTTSAPWAFALSPDGRQVVFVASGDGAPRLWLRSLSSTTAQPLSGTEGASAPFWSPDSRAIGFFAAGALKRLDLNGGTPQTLARAGLPRGGAWSVDGVIVFAPTTRGPLMRVAASGGEAVAATTLGPGQQSHRWPHLLPDGRRLLFLATGSPDATGIHLGALDERTSTRLTPGTSGGAFLPGGPSDRNGWLVWVRGGALVAQRLDPAKAALTGELLPISGAVLADSVVNQSSASVASAGAIAFRTGAIRRQLTWYDRSGTVLGTVGEPFGDNLRNPSLSPDGRRVVATRSIGGNEDVWVIDAARTVRFTFDPADDAYPIWSPGGDRILFRSNRIGKEHIYQKRSSGAEPEERVTDSDQPETPLSWSADGRFLLFFSVDPQFNYDLWVRPMTGEGQTSTALLKTPFREMWSLFSPDGRWIAYMSDESGRDEIFVRPFVPAGTAVAPATAAGGQWQVSTAGGVFPVWRRDGKELYYVTDAGEMMAAPIAIRGATIDPGVPVKLFTPRIVGEGNVGIGRQYDVDPAGRFLINTELNEVPAPITLVMNWKPGGAK